MRKLPLSPLKLFAFSLPGISDGQTEREKKNSAEPRANTRAGVQAQQESQSVGGMIPRSLLGALLARLSLHSIISMRHAIGRECCLGSRKRG